MIYESMDIFESYSAQILTTLNLRCSGVREGTLREACDRGMRAFAPGSTSGYLRGFGTSSRCGGAWMYSAACRELADEWVAIEEEVGLPSTHFLSGYVEPVESVDSDDWP